MTVSGRIMGLAACVASAAFVGQASAMPGATVPWVTLEAEQATTNASVVGPDYTGRTAAREASGRQYVRLASVGDYLAFIAPRESQGVVVRYSVPDGSGEVGLDLSINGGPPRTLALTSKYSHRYGDYPFTNDAAAGSPRNFWDEVRLLPGVIRAGDVVRVEKSVDDLAREYLIDFIDLETVPPPIERPVDSISIIDLGATPDDEADDRPALLAAIVSARSQRKSVWLPAGRFVIAGPVEVSDIVVRGAGMWHTTLTGVADYVVDKRIAFTGTGSNVTLADFSIVGRLDYRDDAEPNDGIGGAFGSVSTLRNLWIEHTKTGAWLTNSDGLIVESCRFRNNIADGMNLCVGMRRTTVRDCTARGTGDDCFAMWPATYTAANYRHGDNRFIDCTAQLPSLAQGFALYGGDGNGVIDCLASDIPYGAGLFASTTFPTDDGFTGTTTFSGCTIVRAGDREGAIGTVANRQDLVGLRIEGTDIIDSPNDAIRFMSVHGRALRDAKFDRMRIGNVAVAGQGHAVAAADDAVGSATFEHVTFAGPTTAALRNVSPTFDITWGEETQTVRPSVATEAPAESNRGPSIR